MSPHEPMEARTRIGPHAVIAFAFALLFALQAQAQEYYDGSDSEAVRRKITRTKEKELSVRVNLAFGELRLKRGDRDYVLNAEFEPPSNRKQDFNVKYSIEGSTGNLLIESKSKKNVNVGEGDGATWNIELPPDLPMKLVVEFGAGEGSIDLTELAITELKVSSGASDVRIEVNKPNSSRAKLIEINSGVSSFNSISLGNLNFQRLKFNGGVGSYDLDLRGELSEKGTVDVEVGLGSVDLVLPKGSEVTVEYDGTFLSSFDIDKSFVKKSKGYYVTSDKSAEDVQLQVRIKAGLGSVDVRRR